MREFPSSAVRKERNTPWKEWLSLVFLLTLARRAADGRHYLLRFEQRKKLTQAKNRNRTLRKVGRHRPTVQYDHRFYLPLH